MSNFEEYDMFNNFENMIDDIYDYVNINKGTILKCDSPKYLIFGFTHVETNKNWGIKLIDFKYDIYYIVNLEYIKSLSKISYMVYHEMIHNPIHDIKQFIIKYHNNINFEKILDDESLQQDIRDYCRMFL